MGGIAGYSAFAFQPNRTITVNNCYSRATITATTGQAGGIFGGSSALLVVKNSYATGTMTSPGAIGGVLGQMGGVTATNDYWDTQTTGAVNAVATWSGTPGTVDITGKTTAEMKSAAMVTLLNQNQTGTPWTIDATKNDGYPILASSTLSSGSFVAENAKVLVYPTLVNDFVTVSSSVQLVEAKLFSISGSVVKTQKLNSSANKIDMSGMVSGIYFLTVQTENGTSTHKIIKK